MEQDELNRLRQQLEQLYQQPHLEIDHSFLRPSFNSTIDEPAGLWQTLQTLWKRASAFLTEESAKESNDSSSGHLAWWQMHHARTGSDMPVFFPGDPEQVKHWLERIYHVKSVRIDHRGSVGDR